MGFARYAFLVYILLLGGSKNNNGILQSALVSGFSLRNYLYLQQRNLPSKQIRYDPTLPRNQPSSLFSFSSQQRPPQLRHTSLVPRNNRPSLGVLKWCKFTGIVTALSFLFHLCGRYSVLGIGATAWNYVALGYPALIGIAALLHMVIYARSGGSGAQIAKSMGGIPCNDPNSRIDTLLDQVFERSGLPMEERPETYLIPAAEPNAFAAGSKTKSVVAVTRGLMERLNDNQLRAVLAHEVAHLRNSDTIQSMQLAAMIAALATARTVGSILMRGADRTARRQGRGPNQQGKGHDAEKRTDIFQGVGWILYGTGMVTATLGSLLRFGSSRTAEYAADAFAKDIGIGEDLASALEIISSTNSASRQPRGNQGLGLASGAYAHAYIDNPPHLESPFVNAFGLFRTHPTTKERVKRLLQKDA